MRVFTINVPTVKAELFTELGIDNRHVDSIGLQAPAANSADINWGDTNTQPAFLPPGESVLLPIRNAKDIFLVGTSGDTLVVILF